MPFSTVTKVKDAATAAGTTLQGKRRLEDNDEDENGAGGAGSRIEEEGPPEVPPEASDDFDPYGAAASSKDDDAVAVLTATATVAVSVAASKSKKPKRRDRSNRVAKKFEYALDFIKKAYPEKANVTTTQHVQSNYKGNLEWSDDEAGKPTKRPPITRVSAVLLPILHAATRGNRPYAEEVVTDLALRADIIKRKIVYDDDDDEAENDENATGAQARSFEEEVFDRIQSMTAALNSGGSRPRQEQQALDAMLTFLTYPDANGTQPSPDYLKQLSARLSVTKTSVHKAALRAELVRANQIRRDEQVAAENRKDNIEHLKWRTSRKRRGIQPIYSHDMGKMKKCRNCKRCFDHDHDESDCLREKNSEELNSTKEDQDDDGDAAEENGGRDAEEETKEAAEFNPFAAAAAAAASSTKKDYYAKDAANDAAVVVAPPNKDRSDGDDGGSGGDGDGKGGKEKEKHDMDATAFDNVDKDNANEHDVKGNVNDEELDFDVVLGCDFHTDFKSETVKRNKDGGSGKHVLQEQKEEGNELCDMKETLANNDNDNNVNVEKRKDMEVLDDKQGANMAKKPRIIIV